MSNRRFNKQTRKAAMGGGMMRKMYSKGTNGNGKPVSKSKNPGLAKMAKTEKGKKVVAKMGFNPDRITAKDGGCMQIKGFGKARRPKKKKYA